MSTLRSSAEILAANDRWKERDNDAMKAILDGFTPAGVFKSAYSNLLSFDGEDYVRSNAFQTLDTDPLLSVLLQDCLDAGGLTFIDKSCVTLDAPIDLKDNCAVQIEDGATLTYTGDATSTVFSNSIKPLVNFKLNGGFLDCDSIVDVTPFTLDTFQKCVFANMTVKNCPDKPVFRNVCTAAGNSYGTIFSNIHMENVGGLFEWEGTMSGKELTVCKTHNIFAREVQSVGIRFMGWASGIHGDTVWMQLQNAGCTGVIWNDSATPDDNVGDYDNSFVNLKIDAFDDANDASTTLLKFNNTKENTVRGFFHSPAQGSFLGTQISEAASTVSYYVEDVCSGPSERAGNQDLWIRRYSKGHMYGSMVADCISLYGKADTTGAYISINDLYQAEPALIYLRTNDGVNREVQISLIPDDGVFRINPPLDSIVKIPSGKVFRFDDSVDAEKLEIRDTGDVHCVDAAAGLILKDRVSGSLYRLKVSSGVLSLEGA